MSPNITENWKKRTSTAIRKKPGGAKRMLGANADMVRRVVRGMGPDKNVRDPACGAHFAVNIAAVHVASFCNSRQKGKAYKNTYDLGKTKPIGKAPQGATVSIRALVDKALCSVTNSKENEIYFGAVEINGSGVRFYGDMCFILETAAIDDQTVVLTSNSYDLVRPPVTRAGTKPKAVTLLSHLNKMAGLWGNDLPEMTVLKALSTRNATERRLTTGQVSDVVLNDEDYLEVLKLGSFDASALQEVRVSAADAAAEGQIGEQLRLGFCPNLAELQWRKHRRSAVKALQRYGVRTRVITTSGRVRA